MKKAAVISLYWNTLGGGERYLATLARVLIKNGYETEIWWPDDDLPQKLQKRFGTTVTDFKINKNAYKIFYQGTILQKYLLEKSYQLLVVLTDGSVPWLFSEKNYLHFQVPFLRVKGRSLINQVKLRKIVKCVCNSKFTQKFIEAEYGINGQVIYPPIKPLKPLAKTKTILSVGRLDEPLNSKRQDVLIEVFSKMGLTDWELVIAGGQLKTETNSSYLEEMANKFPRVRLLINPSWDKLRQLYGQATIYWHAAGFGSNITTEPEKFEHFGMSTVEAMSAGAIPLAFDGGGQKEIINPGKNGYLWKSKEELVVFTNQILGDQAKLQQFAKEAIKRSQEFSEERFEDEWQKLIV